MARYKPSVPFTVACRLRIPTQTKVSGVPKKTWSSDKESPIINVSFRSYGGTEQSVNGLTAVLDTAQVETWYRPEISSGCRLELLGTSKVYEIISEPENIELRNQYSTFKVERVKGGA